MFPSERDINNFPSCCHSRENSYLKIWHVTRHFLETAPCRSLNLEILMSNIMTAQSTWSTAAAQICYDRLPCREITFSRECKLAFKERDSCYINRALHMTSLTGNTLRIRFNSLRVRFFTKRLHMSTKREGSRGRWQRRRRVVCFTQNKGETKNSNYWCQSRNCLIAFFFIPVLKLPAVPRGWISNLYVPVMIALNFAQRHRHFTSVTSQALTLFFIWLANEEDFLCYNTSWF